ncbi:MAG: GNAT family N-acetyltransferase [Verrucomicrobiota bacterium]|nr:GNAT family N-acetyltransferase [Verrucomicrobiota bacterium]
MPITYQAEDVFFQDFLPLIAELVCGVDYAPENQQHATWLRKRIAALFMSGGRALCIYDDEGVPMGFLLLVHDRGPDGVKRFQKKATIALLGFYPAYRGNGQGTALLSEAQRYVKDHGGECIYVSTYSKNARVINFFSKNGFIPAAYHPGENGIADEGQIYLYNEIV